MANFKRNGVCNLEYEILNLNEDSNLKYRFYNPLPCSRSIDNMLTNDKIMRSFFI